MIPGLYDGRNKAFFFVHYEQIRFPNSFTRTRTVFNPRVYDGWFRYQFGTEVREVNLLQLAAANGQISATDPTMMKLLGQIDAATKTTGTRAAQSDPLYDNYVWQSPSELFEHQPTVRLDYNLTNNHRLQRIVLHDHGQADARLPEQHRSAVSRRAEPARLRLDAAAASPRPCGPCCPRTSSTRCAAG